MENTEELASLIKRILTAQRFAVLATQSEGQPYCNLVAFAEADNLKSLIFVTSSGIYLSKHPELKDFVYKPLNALMKVAVTDYVVATFEGVRYLLIEHK